MKTMAHTLASGALLLTTVSFTFAIPVQAKNPAHETCELILADPYFSQVSWGECVSLITIENNYFEKGTGSLTAIAVKECNLLQQYDPDLYESLFATEDECLEYMRTAFE